MASPVVNRNRLVVCPWDKLGCRIKPAFLLRHVNKLQYPKLSDWRTTSAQEALQTNRGHWTIESCHHVIDWNFDEDRSRIQTGYAPQNITRLRRFSIGIIKSKGIRSVAQKMTDLTRNTRALFDYLRMSGNSCSTARIWASIHTEQIHPVVQRKSWRPSNGCVSSLSPWNAGVGRHHYAHKVKVRFAVHYLIDL